MSRIVLRIICRCFWIVPLLLAGGCSSALVPPPAPLTKETLYARGHQLYVGQDYDSAAALLHAALEMDSAYLDPVSDLAQLYFDRGMIDTSRSPHRVRDLQRSLRYYTLLEGTGRQESDAYDRIGALALALNDHSTFLTYAKKNADRFPFDRQYHNLGIAYYKAGSFQASIRVLKEAIEKFRDSEYIGGMYRQLGRSYMSVDRNQTAERTFYEGLSAIDRMVARLRRGGGEKEIGADARLAEDRVGILLSLKGLHTLYKQAEKLARVEQLLREAGYSK
jgi:tetratricopeptide (TPR) repeat protein